MNTDFNTLSNTDLLALYNELRDTLSELDSDTDFDEYCETEFELDSVFAELESRNL